MVFAEDHFTLGFASSLPILRKATGSREPLGRITSDASP
jgi:hypothetical protein